MTEEEVVNPEGLHHPVVSHSWRPLSGI